MVNNIPTAQEFYTSGKELLDYSWDVIANLLTNLDDAGYYGIDLQEISESYWNSAKRQLTTALSITQQGIEFILKGKIAKISPFLLIADPPRKWPSPYRDVDIDFAHLRTIDAQDLVRVYDTFSGELLPQNFVEKFHEMRNKRNRIMHSVDKNITVHVTDVIETLLFMFNLLFPDEIWPILRLDFLRSAPDAELESDEYSTHRVCREMSLVIKLLEPAQVKEFFNIDKNQRRYICPGCSSRANTDFEFEYKLAVLTPKESNSNSLYCPICNEIYSVKRQSCGKNCLGNVISENGICLTCNS